MKKINVLTTMAILAFQSIGMAAPADEIEKYKCAAEANDALQKNFDLVLKTTYRWVPRIYDYLPAYHASIVVNNVILNQGSFSKTFVENPWGFLDYRIYTTGSVGNLSLGFNTADLPKVEGIAGSGNNSTKFHAACYLQQI